MRLAISLALHAGLRFSEIRACERAWVVPYENTARIILQDGENFRTKGGNDGLAWLNGLVLDEGFAKELLALPEGRIIQASCGWEWFEMKCNAWVRQFIPKDVDRKGMHRLRAVYSDRVKAKFEKQILASQVGVDAARVALGHKSAATTLEHYLTS